MQATLFEFRNRWWVIFSIFFAAFFAYSLDPAMSGVVIAKWLTRHLGTAANDNSYPLRIVVPVRLLLDNACNSDGFAVQAQRGLTDFPVRTQRDGVFTRSQLFPAAQYGIGQRKCPFIPPVRDSAVGTRFGL